VVDTFFEDGNPQHLLNKPIEVGTTLLALAFRTKKTRLP